jgi:CelD/BcsL family acetyltransferase involved in cellulose biosynthesis
MKFSIVRNDSDFYSLKPKWDKILLSSEDCAITQTWEWMTTWWRVYGKSKKLFIICGYVNNELIGILPLSTDKKALSIKGFFLKSYHILGSGRTKQRGVVSDYLNIITKKGYEDKFIRNLFPFLEKNREWDEIIIENIDATSRLFELFIRYLPETSLFLSIKKKHPSPFIQLPDSWEEFLNNISTNLRYKIKRGRKEFENIGGSYRAIQQKKELSKAFQDLEQLHQYSWTSRGEPGAFSDKSWRSFHKILIPMIFNRNWLKLSFLDINGEPVAANYNFGFHRKVHFYQSGLIRHDNKHIRLGLLLHSYCIEDAIKQKYLEYDFLSVGKSGGEYKYLWTDLHRDLITVRLAKNGKKETLYKILLKIMPFVRKVKKRIVFSRL